MSDAAVLAGRRLRIVFRREADRIAHVVQSIEAGSPVTWLESVEGTADEAWPASPPLQEIHFERRDGGRQVALAVGMAGRSHWSVSVEMDADGTRATFDVACRLHAAPENLGSLYRIPQDRAGDCLLSSATSIDLGGQLKLIAIEDTPTSLHMYAADSLAIVRFAASEASQAIPEKLPATLRWKYEIIAAEGDRS